MQGYDRKNVRNIYIFFVDLKKCAARIPTTSLHVNITCTFEHLVRRQKPSIEKKVQRSFALR